LFNPEQKELGSYGIKLIMVRIHFRKCFVSISHRLYGSDGNIEF